ncbi:hypothetical protein B0H13DRAFT_1853295 [Mycena leptocephala]|nr:hypothetical protein B0H13DRAFT_1853295 [Mycena leptocephala]
MACGIFGMALYSKPNTADKAPFHYQTQQISLTGAHVGRREDPPMPAFYTSGNEWGSCRISCGAVHGTCSVPPRASGTFRVRNPPNDSDFLQCGHLSQLATVGSMRCFVIGYMLRHIGSLHIQLPSSCVCSTCGEWKREEYGEARKEQKCTRWHTSARREEDGHSGNGWPWGQCKAIHRPPTTLSSCWGLFAGSSLGPPRNNFHLLVPPSNASLNATAGFIKISQYQASLWVQRMLMSEPKARTKIFRFGNFLDSTTNLLISRIIPPQLLVKTELRKYIILGDSRE